jgi:hypothetical protein
MEKALDEALLISSLGFALGDKALGLALALLGWESGAERKENELDNEAGIYSDQQPGFALVEIQ